MMLITPGPVEPGHHTAGHLAQASHQPCTLPRRAGPRHPQDIDSASVTYCQCSPIHPQISLVSTTTSTTTTTTATANTTTTTPTETRKLCNQTVISQIEKRLILTILTRKEGGQPPLVNVQFSFSSRLACVLSSNLTQVKSGEVLVFSGQNKVSPDPCIACRGSG